MLQEWVMNLSFKMLHANMWLRRFRGVLPASWGWADLIHGSFLFLSFLVWFLSWRGRAGDPGSVTVRHMLVLIVQLQDDPPKVDATTSQPWAELWQVTKSTLNKTRTIFMSNACMYLKSVFWLCSRFVMLSLHFSISLNRLNSQMLHVLLMETLEALFGLLSLWELQFKQALH